MFHKSSSFHISSPTPFSQKIVMIGLGSVGQGILPLLARHFDIKNQLVIISPCPRAKSIADKYQVPYHKIALTPDNYKGILHQHLIPGDFLLNLCVNVSSHDLIEFTQELGCPYLDTSIEPWEGDFFDAEKDVSERSNYAFREQILALKSRLSSTGPTAVVTHGANPGIVSSLIKQALINIAHETNFSTTKPTSRREWAQLAQQLGIKTIHVSEYDWQVSHIRKQPGEFVNTWSIEGLYSEGCQPAELGWGSHEKNWPSIARKHHSGCQAAIYLDQPGIKTEVKSWTPHAGQYKGLLISHNESIAIADYLTLKDHDGNLLYRPTLHYCYRPCDDAVLSLYELSGQDLHLQPNQRLLSDDIADGIDELGVLLMGHEKGAYWFGSHLSIQKTRELAPHNSATTLQIASGALAGLLWAMNNPNRGLVEPDELDFEFVLDICEPYLGSLTGHYTDWTPLKNVNPLFSQDLDHENLWQFINFLVE